MKLIRKDILNLAIPVLIEQAFITIMGMVNTIMAGHIGKEAVSAVGLVDSINNIFIAFFSALAVGGTVVVAQYVGHGEVKRANEAAKQALYSSAIVAALVTIAIWIFRQPLIVLLYGSAEQGVLDSAYSYLGITLLTYPLIAIQLVASGALRGVGDTRTPAKVTIVMNVINIIFSFLFIYGIHLSGENTNIDFNGLGIEGAAFGIAIARIVGAAMICLVLIRGSKILKLKNITKFRFNKSILMPIVNIGVPASVESLLFNVGKLITQIYIVSIGTVAIAANAVSSSIASMLNVPGMAFAIAATTVVGKNIGEGKSEEARKSLLYLTLLSSICLAIFGMISVPAAHFLASLYSTVPDIIELTAKVIQLNGLIIIIWPFSFVLPAGLKGAGDAQYTLVTAIIGMWIFRITLGYILSITFGIGLLGVWIAMYTDWIVRGVLYYFRLKGEKWKQKSIVGKSVDCNLAKEA